MYVFSTNINNTGTNGIVNVTTLDVLCICSEQSAGIILDALRLEPYTPLEDAGQRGEAYLCPKCNGQGTTAKPPYVPGDVDHWVSSSLSHVCDICNGAKLLYKAQSSTPVQEGCNISQQGEQC